MTHCPLLLLSCSLHFPVLLTNTWLPCHRVHLYLLYFILPSVLLFQPNSAVPLPPPPPPTSEPLRKPRFSSHSRTSCLISCHHKSVWQEPKYTDPVEPTLAPLPICSLFPFSSCSVSSSSLMFRSTLSYSHRKDHHHASSYVSHPPTRVGIIIERIIL